jgi:tRNA(fMet)-specific endonuclease VapC
MKNYLIDTDILIDYLNGKYSLDKKLDEVGIAHCFVSEITIGELYFGAYRSSKKEKRIKQVDEVVETFQTVPISEFLKAFGEQKAILISTGNHIGDFDILIAVTARERDMILVTSNEKHHSRVEGLVIENWRLTAFNQYI